MQSGRISGSEVEDYVSLPLEQDELQEMTFVTGRIAGNGLRTRQNCQSLIRMSPAYLKKQVNALYLGH